MKQIPNLFTLLNLVFGCIAIIFILQNGLTIHYDADGSQFVDIPEKIWMASLFIGLAAIIDFLDGFVARMFNAVSELGKELDSLADVVSFGVAPAMILYQFLRMSYAREENGLETPVIFLMPSLLVAAAAAYRLAKFNVDLRQQYGFRGVPTPAVGILIASFPLIYWDSNLEWVAIWLLNKWFLYSMILLVSWLMVSDIPMLAFKFKGRGLPANLPLILILLIGIFAAFFMKWLAIPVIFLVYIILSLIFKERK